MIRASKQVVPKNKVVDHLVLYNFYFDRDSSANMKFGVLDGQSRLKSLNFGQLCLQCPADLDVRVATRHAGEHLTA